MNYDKIGSFIQQKRKDKGLTQKQLAKKAGLSNQSISFYEANRRKPKIETWKRLADFFGVSVPYLQGYAKINVPNDLKFDSKQDALDCIEKIMKALDISTEDLRTEHRK